MNDDVRSQFYETYSATQNWRGPPVDLGASYFQHISQLAGFGAGLRILEFGFGQGAFLDWAAAQGHSVAGVEILPDMVAAAAARGHEVHMGSLDTCGFQPGEFDLICAFDVLEHLDLAQIVAFMQATSGLAKPAGKLFLRFPNGESPFSLAYQYGDVTHKTVLSAAIIEQVAQGSGWRAARTLRPRLYPPGFKERFKRWTAYRARDLIEWVVGVAYFGRKANLEPNVEILLTRVGKL